MARVICTLPNASDTINGVKFALDRGQMISDEIDDATAAHFASIDGYRLVEVKPAKEPAKPAEPAKVDPAKEPAKPDAKAA